MASLTYNIEAITQGVYTAIMPYLIELLGIDVDIFYPQPVDTYENVYGRARGTTFFESATPDEQSRFLLVGVYSKSVISSADIGIHTEDVWAFVLPEASYEEGTVFRLTRTDDGTLTGRAGRDVYYRIKEDQDIGSTTGIVHRYICEYYEL